jgi:serine O-acetyltransferase
MSIRQCLGRMREDVDVVIERDPSIHRPMEALLAPHLIALWLYRVSHALYQSGRPVLARGVCLLGRHLSGGIEIHPGAVVGRRVFIDHGCGTVIGETAVIGDDVTLYHQVTLGAVGWQRDMARPPGERRHPKLGSGVVVGANSVILGPVRIGDAARIGAQALVTEDVPPGAVLYAARTPITRQGLRATNGGAAAAPMTRQVVRTANGNGMAVGHEAGRARPKIAYREEMPRS